MKKKTIKEKPKDIDRIIQNFSMPCFSCNEVHRCAYYNDTAWDCWIIANKTCPKLVHFKEG